MYARVAKRVRSRDQISMNRSMVGIPYLGARNPHCPEYPLIHEILVGIPSSGDSVQWGFRPVGIPSSGDSVQWGFRPVGILGGNLITSILFLVPILITNHVANFKGMEPINIISIYCFMFLLRFIANEQTITWDYKIG